MPKGKININSGISQEFLDKKVLIGTDGLTIGELLDCERMVLVPLDETTLAACVLEGDKPTWRHFLGDNPTPDLFFAETPVKRIMMTASVDSDNRVLINAPQCIPMMVKDEVKADYKDKKDEEIKTSPAVNRKKPFLYFRGARINLFEKEQLKMKNRNFLIKQRDYLMRQLDFEVISTDTNIWITKVNDTDEEPEMKYRRMLNFLAQIQQQRALNHNKEGYKTGDFHFEIHQKVFEEIKKKQQYDDDIRVRKVANKARTLIKQMLNDKILAQVEIVERPTETIRATYADPFICDYCVDRMIRKRHLLIITDDDSLRDLIRNDCNVTKRDYNNQQNNVEDTIGDEYYPERCNGDIIMTITEQIQLIDSVLQD